MPLLVMWSYVTAMNGEQYVQVGGDMSAAEVVCRQMLALAPESGTIKTKYTVYMPKLCNIYNLQQKFWFKCAQTRVLAKAF